MIKQILDMLPYVEYGESKLIDIAKGKNKLPQTRKELRQYLTRLRNGNN